MSFVKVYLIWVEVLKPLIEVNSYCYLISHVCLFTDIWNHSRKIIILLDRNPLSLSCIEFSPYIITKDVDFICCVAIPPSNEYLASLWQHSLLCIIYDIEIYLHKLNIQWIIIATKSCVVFYFIKLRTILGKGRLEQGRRKFSKTPFYEVISTTWSY